MISISTKTKQFLVIFTQKTETVNWIETMNLYYVLMNIFHDTQLKPNPPFPFQYPN